MNTGRPHYKHPRYVILSIPVLLPHSWIQTFSSGIYFQATSMSCYGEIQFHARVKQTKLRAILTLHSSSFFEAESCHQGVLRLSRLVT
jgi:hypothetical protein